MIAHGGLTYDLCPMQRGYTLEPRLPRHIAKPRRFPVVGTHKCGTSWPEVVPDEEGKSYEQEEPPF